MTALVTKYVPLVAGAPDGIRRLRQFIVDLAVSNKLIAGGSADVWQQVRLSEVVTSFQNGVSSRGAVDGVAVTVLRLADIKAGEICLEDLRTLMLDTESIAKYLLLEGDTLVIRVNGSADLVGRLIVYGETGRALHCDHFIRLRLDRGRVEPRFLKLIGDSSSIRASIQGLFVSTAGQKTVNQGHIGSLAVQLPPLDEQHRIVAKVDELMALCDRLEADQADAEAAHAQLVQALLDSLTQATDAADFRASWQRLSEHFHTLFNTEASIDALKQTVLQLAVMGKLVPQDGSDECVSAFLARIDQARTKQHADKATRSRARLGDRDEMAEPPYEAPLGWMWRNLGAVLNITGGVTLGRKLSGRKLVSMPYLRVANVQRSYLVLDQIKQVEVPEDEVEKYKLLPNDLLIAEGGDWDKVGRTAIWRNEIAGCLHQNHVFRARAITDEFNPRWAELYLNSMPARNYFAGASKQTTNLASINMTQLRACAFPVAPLPEQQRIIDKVDELMAVCDQLKASLAETRQIHAQLATALVEQAVA